LLAARGWGARAARWDEMLNLLRERPQEVIARRERERLARVGIIKRGRWICGRWFPRWRLEEIREKYRDPPDDQVEEEGRCP